MSEPINIDPLNVIPLSLQVQNQNSSFTGTGFIVQYLNTNYIITNWHMVTGRNPVTKQPLSSTGFADPEKLGVWFHLKNKLGSWILKFIDLINANGEKKWKEHNTGNKVDVIALPIPTFDDIQIYPLDLSMANVDILISPSEDVSIVGFPLGHSAGGKFPIWKTGHVASEIEIDYNNKPIFLIDATTKPGMSGSPVFAKRIGIVRNSNGFTMSTGITNRFLGIYSGRIQDETDIGMVWKPKIIEQILSI
jgi:S1-C subfamily serine protease